MHKIHTKIVYQFNKAANDYELTEDEYYFYEGNLALAGGGSGGGGSTTTVQKSDPWDAQKAHLQYAFQEANKLYNWDNPQYYPGSTVVPFSPETQTALGLQTQRALNGSPISNAANTQLTDTINGNYLYGGQGFNQALDAASRKIIPQINSQYELAGRSGSGLAQTSIAQALSDSFANQYSNERENQLRGTLLAPQIASQDYTDISKLAEVGQQREQLSAQQLQDQINRFNYYQNLPQQKLQQYAGLVNGNYGNTTVQTQALSRNPVAGALGGAIGGAAVGSSILPGWGTGIGAGVGLLAGIL
jgi:hypothetical protein